MKRLPLLLAVLLIASSAYAHGPNKGPHGGTQVDAGEYHVEMVTKSTSLTIYLKDEADKPVDAKGHKGTGIFVVGGKPQRIELTPDGENRLSGTSAVALPASLKGAVQIVLPTGKSIQAKFE